MTNLRLIVSVLLCVLLSNACSAARGPSIDTNVEGNEVRVVIHSVRNAEHLNIEGVAVYGDVLVKSEGRLRSVDLGCIYLSDGEARSSKPYVDSVAHIMTNSYPADKDGAVRAKLYWIFSGRTMTDFKQNNLTLLVEQSRGPCFTSLIQSEKTHE